MRLWYAGFHHFLSGIRYAEPVTYKILNFIGHWPSPGMRYAREVVNRTRTPNYMLKYFTGQVKLMTFVWKIKIFSSLARFSNKIKFIRVISRAKKKSYFVAETIKYIVPLT